MKKSILILFLFTCIVKINLSQNLNELNFSNNTLDSIHSIISYDFIFLDGIKGMEETRWGTGILKYIPSDTLKYYHNISFSDQEKNIYHQIYNGKSLVYFDHEKKECFPIDLDSFSYGYNYVTGNIVSSLIPRFLFDTLYFKDILNQDEISEVSVVEEYAFGTNCNKLSIKFKDNEEIQNNFSNYFFDSKTQICMGFRDSFNFAGNKFTSTFLVFNILQSCAPNESVFSIDKYKDLGYNFKYPQSIVNKSSEEKTTRESGEIENRGDTLFNFEKYKGKVLIIDFWYIGCGPCLKLIPVLEKLHEEYPEVAFIGMNVRDDVKKIEKFVENKKIKYPVMQDRFGFEKEYKMTGFPVILIFDENGKLLRKLDGYSDGHYEEISEILRK